MKLHTTKASRAPHSPWVSIYFFRSRSMNSKTSISLVLVWMTLYNLTILGCLSSFMRLISLIAVDGVPSSASRWISFSATILLVILERSWIRNQQSSSQRHVSPKSGMWVDESQELCCFKKDGNADLLYCGLSSLAKLLMGRCTMREKYELAIDESQGFYPSSVGARTRHLLHLNVTTKAHRSSWSVSLEATKEEKLTSQMHYWSIFWGQKKWNTNC